MPRRGFSPAQSYVPNLAPMVDVVMVILVFFMLGSSLVISEGVLPTELPSQAGPGGGAPVTIVPTIRMQLEALPDGQGCRIIVEDMLLPDNAYDVLSSFLRDKIAAGADPAGRILIGADPAVEYQAVISAMDACIQAGFSNIQFSVNPNLTALIE